MFLDPPLFLCFFVEGWAPGKTTDVSARGSAIPCGSVSPDARLNTPSAVGLLPLVSPVALLYWKTWSDALSTIQIVVPPFGLSVIPVGFELAVAIVQLPSNVPPTVYLKTLSVPPSST